MNRDLLLGGCLLVIVIKAVLAVLFWAVGHVTLIFLIGLPLTSPQVVGGAIVLAVLCPVNIRFRGDY